jgi:hypothetical protein
MRMLAAAECKCELWKQAVSGESSVRSAAQGLDRSGAYQASCAMGNGAFSGLKRQGRNIDHSPPSSAEIKNGESAYRVAKCRIVSLDIRSKREK